MAKKARSRNAAGTGTIRKKTVHRDGREYTYWEGRYTSGYDPGTGKQVQRSITGKTQKEVAQKLKAATAALDNGTYIEPNKQTVGQWMDIWAETYLGSVKPRTLDLYKAIIRLYIKPALGAVRLEELNAHTIQMFYNNLSKPTKERPNGLSAKTIKNVHGVVHKALQQAVLTGYLRFNPADACTLPRIERKELVPLDDIEIAAFLAAIQGHRFETLYAVTLFSGLRESEVMGLMWDCVDFESGTITINKQLQRLRGNGGEYRFMSPKNGKKRIITPAASVMTMLKRHKVVQAKQRLFVGEGWEDSGLVFTDELGHHLSQTLIYRDFKNIAASIGRPDARFHDLRHSYAVAALRAGDDIKTVQETLGHATAAFTLDVYGHVTNQMKRASAERMEAYIKTVSEA